MSSVRCPSSRSRSTTNCEDAVADAPSLVAAVDEQAPQVRLGVGVGDLGQHHEPDQLAVGLDAPHPRHDRRAVDDSGTSASANDSGIVATNRCWLRWVVSLYSL